MIGKRKRKKNTRNLEVRFHYNQSVTFFGIEIRSTWPFDLSKFLFFQGRKFWVRTNSRFAWVVIYALRQCGGVRPFATLILKSETFVRPLSLEKNIHIIWRSYADKRNKGCHGANQFHLMLVDFC